MSVYRKLSVVLLVIALALAASVSFARKKKEKEPGGMAEQQRALHALNRLTFGARPGDVDRVLAMGVDKWIELQLHPEKIDDSVLESRLAPLRTLNMDTATMLRDFPPPQVIKAAANGKLPMPRGEDERAIYQAQLERERDKQERKLGADAQNGADAAPSDEQKQARREQHQQAVERARELLAMAPEERFRALLRMDDFDRRALAALPPPKRLELLAGLDPRQRETVIAMVNPALVVTSELQQGKLLRDIYGERQLQEVMTDFWFNHFNVFVGKGADRYLITSYERDVIRPHALGKFKDLLVATAKSPAMLFYLDNWMSVGPDSDFARYGGPRPAGPRPRPAARMGVRCGWFGCFPRAGARIPVNRPRPRNPQAAQAKKQQTGLNENYARELMELHTLGVNGGYTQKDVTEVAKVFTGWTIEKPLQGGQFVFNPRRHEPGTKYVLGHKIKEHGEDEGMQVLEVLAHHPSTAHFISTKLAQRFVADDPPASLVDRMAQSFLDSDGDIRAVLRTMFHSPEFWSPQVYRAKVKTPLEFVASAVRATGAQVDDTMTLVQALNRMGMPLYGAQPPTGYSSDTETWVNSGALLDRMNFALMLANSRLPGVTIDPEQMLTAYHIGKHRKVEAEAVADTDPQALLAQLEEALLAGDVSRQTDETIRQQLQDPKVTTWAANNGTDRQTGVLAGLLLGSPEFQKR